MIAKRKRSAFAVENEERKKIQTRLLQCNENFSKGFMINSGFSYNTKLNKKKKMLQPREIFTSEIYRKNSTLLIH